MPFDQPQRLKLVDDAAERDRLDFQQVGQSSLVDAFVLRQISQHVPLRARETEAARVLLEASPEQARDFVQQKSKRRRIQFHGSPINKLAYDTLCLVYFKCSKRLITRSGRSCNL